MTIAVNEGVFCLYESWFDMASRSNDWVYAKQANESFWSHLESVHNLPGLSPASVRNNKKVWRMAHARMHGMRAGQLGADHEELPNQ